MNNLLQSLTSHRLKLCAPEADLKRLLSAVKNERNHDSKLSDAFYDSLEAICLDLRTVTVDNRDAEAFLKPVPKMDYPDYYDIIQTPMDLQTMLKKVKQKQYKSKREFADDLELIWSNCFTYNSGDNHPLRLCATRLRTKADKLLRNITDKKDRNDPPIPASFSLSDGPLKSKVNGVMLNGHSRQHSTPPPNLYKPKAPIKVGTSVASKSTAKETAFGEMPAIVRTASGMSTFMELDALVDNGDPGPSTLAYQNGTRHTSAVDRLRSFADSVLDSDDDDWGSVYMNGDVGEKRKLTYNGSQRPFKRARTRESSLEPNQDPVEIWWEIAQSPALLGNSIPALTYPSSKIPDSYSNTAQGNVEPLKKKRGKRRKKKHTSASESRALLNLINNNIKTLKRVRRTHDKFLALNLNNDDANNSGVAAPIVIPEPLAEEEEVDVRIDERPWRPPIDSTEIFAESADDCLHWMGTKVLEHAGFQGSSKAALDVLTGVAAEYLSNIGRTIRFLCDKFSRTMTPEEIILHTLFETGIVRVYELERYIRDDVERYGVRLKELEKKLVGAYRDVTAVEAMDDEALFGNEDEEEGELVMGNFADAFGEDFLGLRELGIAADFGLSSLSIPKKLLRGKNRASRNMLDDDKPKEPPPPYPPPPSFVPLDSTKVDDQIGLLRPFYTQKINTIAATSVPLTAPIIPQPPVLAPPPSSLKLPWQVQAVPQRPQPVQVMPVVLPDDTPNPARTKIGPLGQIVKPSASAMAASSKKKGKAKEGSSIGGLPNSSGTATGSGPADDAITSPQVVRAMSVASTATAGTGPVTGGAETTKKKKPAAPKKKDKADKTNKPDHPNMVTTPVITASA